MASPDIDTTIRELFKKLEERKANVAKLKEQTEQKWKTNATFRLIGATATINIQTAPQPVIDEVVVNLSLMVLGQREAARLLKREFAPKVYGYSVEDWFLDIEKRMATINIRDEETKLAELEARLNSVLSPEERRRIEVALLMQEISG